jgi:hypothetical protein
MTSRIINNVKYIALIDDNTLKLTSLNDCICYTLGDIFLNCESESDSVKVSDLLALFHKTNGNEYTNITNDIICIRKIYGFLNSLEEKSFYFIKEETFEEDTIYIEYNIWWKQLQLLIKNLENIIINKQK